MTLWPFWTRPSNSTTSNAELIELRDSVRQSKTLLNDALHRAEAANQAGELEAAKKAVEEALAVDSSDSRARALEGDCEQGIGRPL